MSSGAIGKDAPTNARGIPLAPFVDKVEDYVSSRADVDPTMKSFQEMISSGKEPGHRQVSEEKKGTLPLMLFGHFRYAETEGFAQPDSDPIDATFELNDTLYARARVPPTREVYLWLGANVMLSYPIEEAETMLEGKLSGAQQTLKNCEEDLDFLREQVTTLEVATARVYNWDVTMKRKEKAEAGK